MVIIEGSDLAGKTTLAEHLVKAHGAHFAHLGRPPLGQRHWEIVRRALMTNPNNTVYDRMVVGSYVFGIIKPDKYNINAVTYAELTNWQMLVNQPRLKALVIQAYADEHTLEKRFDDRGDDYINKQELLDSAALYRNVFKKWEWYGQHPYLIYNSGKQTLQQFLHLRGDLIASYLLDDSIPNQETKVMIDSYMPLEAK